MKSKPTVIIGGGIVGVSIAYNLAADDRPVALFEKNSLGSGTTAASIAQFMNYQGEPDRGEHQRRRLSWEWYEPRIERGEFSFEEVGTLHTAGSERDLKPLEELHASFREFGLGSRMLSPADLTEYGLDPDRFAGGVLVPEDGILDPTEIINHMAESARANGADIETGVAVTDVVVEDGSVAGIRTTDGDVEAATVINAAGPWAPEINDMAGVTAPLRHTQGPILVLQANRSHRVPLTFFEDKVYVRQEGADDLLAGRFARDYADTARLDPDHARPIEESFYLTVADVVDRYFSSLSDVRILNEWNGLRTVTPDGLPIVDDTPVDGYLLAVGMSGYGVTTAPAIGDLLARWLRNGEKPELLEGLSLGRFDSQESGRQT